MGTSNFLILLIEIMVGAYNAYVFERGYEISQLV